MSAIAHQVAQTLNTPAKRKPGRPRLDPSTRVYEPPSVKVRAATLRLGPLIMQLKREGLTDQLIGERLHLSAGGVADYAWRYRRAIKDGLVKPI